MSERIARTLEAFAQQRHVAVVMVLVVALLALGLVTVALQTGDDLAEGEARLRPTGRVEVSIDGAEFVAATDETLLNTGDRAWVFQGSAVLELPGGSAAHLRNGSQVTIGGASGADLSLERGDLLAEVPDGTLDVDGGSARVTVGAGASKLRRSASLVAGSYAGSLLLSGTGQSLSVDDLHQATVAGTGRVPESARPLAINDDDPWDRRFLAAVLDLDQRLNAFRTGFEALLPSGAGATAGFFADLLPSLAVGPLSDADLAVRSPGENLIGLTLVSLVEDRYRSFEEAYRRIFVELRDEGARWGLAAAIEGLGGTRVVNSVLEAIDQTDDLQIAVSADVPDDDASGPGSGDAAESEAAGQPGGSAEPEDAGAPAPTSPPPTSSEPEPTSPPSTTTTLPSTPLLPGPDATTTTTVPTTTTTAPAICDGLIGSVLCEL